MEEIRKKLLSLMRREVKDTKTLDYDLYYWSALPIPFFTPFIKNLGEEGLVTFFMKRYAVKEITEKTRQEFKDLYNEYIDLASANGF